MHDPLVMTRGYKRIDYGALARYYPKVGHLTAADIRDDALESFMADAVRAELHQLGLRLPTDSARVSRVRDATSADVLDVYRALWDEFLTARTVERAVSRSTNQQHHDDDDEDEQ